MHNVPTFQELASLCDNQHAHEPWGQTATGWAASEETAYPWELCRAIATKFALCMQQLGAICTTPAFATQTLQLQQIRPQTTACATCLQIVAVGQRICNCTHHSCRDTFVPSNARLISTPPLGHIASEGYKTIGEQNSYKQPCQQSSLAWPVVGSRPPCSKL